MSNKVKFGLKNVHYSKMTYGSDGAITYATPKRIPGAVNISLPPQGEDMTFYADDIAFFRGFNNQGYKGTLEMALILDEFRQDCLGEKKAAVNDVIYEKAGDQPTSFALLFEFDGDKKAVKHALYNCIAGRVEIASGTKTPSLEPKTEILNITCTPRESDGIVKSRRARGEGETDAVYDNWYAAVVLPAES